MRVGMSLQTSRVKNSRSGFFSSATRRAGHEKYVVGTLLSTARSM
jgi:hypothetical protein